MKFKSTPVAGSWVISLDRIGDDRGHFARAYCHKEFETQGIRASFVQSNTSFSREAGTLRGLHYQTAPAEEAKLVRCIRGAIFDAIFDMRPNSPTYLQSFGIELTAENTKMLYVPEGCAHGYLTMIPDSEAFYMSSAFYTPECERGVRYDDPAVGIDWPVPVNVVSEKDGRWPLLNGVGS